MISLVCPVYNEERYIEELLCFYLSLQTQEVELLILDGNSSDRTREIVSTYADKNPGIRLIPNPQKYVSFALNTAVRRCRGEVIIRLDAHTRYSPDYVEKVVNAFDKTQADIVGGPMRAIGVAPFQKAVAHATSTSFGIGNSHFHFEDYEGYTDSVYLGAWRKSVFDRIGYFDEQLIRNQDDEFHYRARNAGLKIYQDPAIRSYYFPRASIRALFSQYFQYGWYKPLVLRKVRSGLRARHLIPSLFVGYLALAPVALFWSPLALVPGGLYLALDIYFSMRAPEGWKARIHSLAVYPILHISYGLGFLAGIMKALR